MFPAVFILSSFSFWSWLIVLISSLIKNIYSKALRGESRLPRPYEILSSSSVAT
jgi:hypothetical protein